MRVVSKMPKLLQQGRSLLKRLDRSWQGHTNQQTAWNLLRTHRQPRKLLRRPLLHLLPQQAAQLVWPISTAPTPNSQSPKTESPTSKTAACTTEPTKTCWLRSQNHGSETSRSAPTANQWTRSPNILSRTASITAMSIIRTAIRRIKHAMLSLFMPTSIGSSRGGLAIAF